MGVPSGMELFVIVAVVVLLFGGKKIPELAKGLGQGIKNFKNAVKDDEVNVATTTSSEKTDAAKINTTEATTDTVKPTETKAV
ncbi:MAG: twin-arginine translocase TatA/TatE family subunit [Arcobacteraceae bacterium]|jgi:sec-independent protein translocase protein TatA|nr:twin-arginine translocase TatA/TatE family subunit [Arcobacteraceae bacterium]